MAEETKISNINEIAEELGNSVGEKFEKSFNKAQLQQALLAANEKVLGIERMREEALRHKQQLEAISKIKPTVIIDAEEADSESWLLWILKALGLTGAAAAGLAAGLVAGWMDFVKGLLKRLGKLLKLDKLKMPKWIDDFFKAFTKEGKLYKNTMKFIDDFKAPKWFDNLIKAFGKEGKLYKNTMKFIDDFKAPKWFDNLIKAFGKDGKIATKVMKIIDDFKMPKLTFITKIVDFFNPKTAGWIQDITKAIDEVIDLFPKGKGGGTIGKMFKGIGDVFRPLGKIGDALTAPFKTISGLLGTGAKGSGILNSMKAFLKGGMIGRVFRAFAAVGKAIAAPLTIILGIIDGFFEAKDAVSKSDGIMASLVNGIIGAIGGFVDGAIFQLLDLIKDGISWLAGAFGFTAVEKALDSFSFSAIFNEGLDGVYKWVNGIFSFDAENPALSIFSSLLDLVTAPLGLVMNFLKGIFKWGDPKEPWSFSGMVIDVFNGAVEWVKALFSDPVATLTTTLATIGGGALSFVDFVTAPLKKAVAWVLGLFGWDEAAQAAETFSFSGTIMGVFDKAVAWIKGIFADPVAGLTTLLGTIATGVGTFLDFVTAPLKKAVAWVLGLFGWDEAAQAAETFSFTKVVKDAFDTAVKWVTDLFKWSSEPVKEGDSFIVKTVKTVVQTVEEWFGSMFQFDSTSKIIASLVNVVTWLPNLVAKGVAAITAWFLDLLGFKEKSKAVAEAGKKFSFGDMLMGAIDQLIKWFTKLFEIDVEALVKKIPGGEALLKVFGSGEGAKARESLEGAGLSQGTMDFGQWDVDIDEMRKKMQGMNIEQMKVIQKNMMNLASADQIANTDAVGKLLTEMIEKSHTGSILKSSGLILAQKGQVIVDDLLVKGLQESIALLTNSQAIERIKNGGGGQPVIVNNIDNSQKTAVNSSRNTAVQIPTSPHNGQSTISMLQMATQMG